MQQLFLRFFPNENIKEAKKFSMKLPEFELSMAQLQGHLLKYRSSSIGAMEQVPELLRSSKPQTLKKQTVKKKKFI